MKRSMAVRLILMGAGAVSVYAIHRQNECRQAPPNEQQACRNSRSSGASSSSRLSSSSSSSSQSAVQTGVTRGGFGSIARGMSRVSLGS